MHVLKRIKTAEIVFGVVIVLMAILVSSSQQAPRAADRPGTIQSFFGSIVGEWIGTVRESTNGQYSDLKYFHATIKQITPDTYESTFHYYRIDDKTHAPLDIGASTMSTKLTSLTAATNTVSGKGEIRITLDNLKSETHQLTELLRIDSSGTLSGTGSGIIHVGGMPFGLGSNGVWNNDVSAWSVNDGVLKIGQKFKVEFRVFFIKRSFSITTYYTAKRGDDVFALMKNPGTDPTKR